MPISVPRYFIDTNHHVNNAKYILMGEEFLPETQVATSDQVLPLVKSDLALAFLPQKMAEPALMAQEVIGIRLEEEIPARRICLVYDAKRPMNAAAQKLKKILIDKDVMEEKKA